MKTINLLRGLVMITLGSTLASAANAAGHCDAAVAAHLQNGLLDSVTSYLVDADKCLGSEADDDALTQAVGQALGGSSAAPQRVSRALDLLLADLGANADLQPKSSRDTAVAALTTARAQAGSGGGAGSGALAAVQWEWAQLRGLPAVPDLQIPTLLQTACRPPKTAQDCAPARRQADAWLRLAALTQKILAVYAQKSIDLRIAELELRIKQWHAYRDDALPQFWWEYAINSARMAHADKRSRGADGRNPEGYEVIPDSQLIFLHPGASLEWRDAKAGAADKDVKPAIYLELLGINRWSWDEDSGAMRGGKGASVILSYTDRKGAKNLGYGLMFHSRFARQFTLGIARSGGEMVYMLNVDLAEYVKGQLGYWGKIGGTISALRKEIASASGSD